MDTSTQLGRGTNGPSQTSKDSHYESIHAMNTLENTTVFTRVKDASSLAGPIPSGSQNIQFGSDAVPIQYPQSLSQFFDPGDATVVSEVLPGSRKQSNSLPVSVPSDDCTPSVPSAISFCPQTVASAMGPFHSVDSRIKLSLHGEEFSCDLQTLGEDPESIIALLQVTHAERGAWLTVAAHYRRLRNPAAAISVLTALLKVLTKLRIPDDNIKPLFLMMSGCESDLAKRIQEQGGDSMKHVERSHRWLQKVYGNSSPAAYKAPNTEKICGRQPDFASNAALPVRQRKDTDSAASHAESKVVSDTRAAKRKLEEDLESEKAARKSLAARLEEVKKERDNALRMESFAQEQVKREVESRRRAEDRAEREKLKRLNVERERSRGYDGRLNYS